MRFTFEAIGTQWVIDATNSTVPEAELQQRIVDRIALFDTTYSRFRDDSFISTLAHAPGTYQLPDDAQPLFDIYQQLYSLSNGLFTPLIGTTLEQAGYDKSYSLIPKQLHAVPSWDEALDYQFPRITTKLPITLDFGAGGKGYVIDIIATLLQQLGSTDYTIDAGGDILHHSSTVEPLEIALEDPDNTEHAIGIVNIHNQSIAGSSGNRRTWKDFHHIINPDTLSSPHNVKAVWVIAQTALIADSLGTCLFLNPDLATQTHFQNSFAFEYLILFADRTITQSPHFPAQLFFD